MGVDVVYRAGQRGNTVCLCRRPDSPHLYLRWWDRALRGGRGSWVWQSLGHDDEEAGKDAADDAAQVLRKGRAPEAERVLTLAGLLAEYASARTARKSERQQKADQRRMRYFLSFFGAPLEALEMDPDWVEAYVGWRREQGIGDTTIGHEIVFLRGIYQWALTKRVPGQKAPLLPFNPIAGVRRIRTATPNTPVASWATFLRVYRYADRVDRQKLFRPFLMLIHEHGWRLSPWCQLCGNDLDLRRAPLWPHGRIRKRPSTDKMRKGKWVPLTPRSRRACELLLRRHPAIGEAPLFPAPVAKGGWQDQHAFDLLARAERAATRALRRRDPEAEPVKLGGFHALRRKWASDRKGMELVDVAEAGDWHPATLLQHYQKPDAETTLRVTLHQRRGGAK